MHTMTQTVPQFTHTSIADLLSQNLDKRVIATPIDGMLLLPIHPAYDDRGFFSQVCQITDISTAFSIKQINHAHSKQFVTRGYHAEQWNKLITIVSGYGFISVADIRPDSQTYGQAVSGYVGYPDPTSNKNTDTNAPTRETSDIDSLRFDSKESVAANTPIPLAVFLPSGVGNSICVLSKQLDYLYAVDKLYQERDPKDDVAISLFDPHIATNWPISSDQMILSQRDTNAVYLQN